MGTLKLSGKNSFIDFAPAFNADDELSVSIGSFNGDGEDYNDEFGLKTEYPIKLSGNIEIDLKSFMKVVNPLIKKWEKVDKNFSPDEDDEDDY